MISLKRRELIEELLLIQETVTVVELVDYLQVSTATIRRDLLIMEKEGLLIRMHGGIRRKEKGSRVSEIGELPARQKLDLRAAEKLRIARDAASFIQDGECIFIDSGTTPAYIYDFIRHKSILIVTNNLLLIGNIRSTDHARVILGAGDYNSQHHLVDGQLFLDVLMQFNFQHAFIGVSGYDCLSHTLTCTSLNASSIKKHAMRQSLHTYVVADSSKRKEKGIVTFAKTEEVTAILTTACGDIQDVKNLISC